VSAHEQPNWIVGIALAAIFGVMIVGAVLSFGGDTSDDASDEREVSQERASEQGEQAAPADDMPAIDDLVEAADSIVEPNDPETSTSAESGGPKRVIELQNGDTVEVPAGSPAARALQAREARLAAEQLEAQAMANPGPTGPESWSAPISPEEEAEIQAAFDAIPEPDPRVTREDRKTSIEVVRVVVEDCFRALQTRQPGRRGRIAVAWTAMAAGGEGLIQEPQITLNLKLREPLFEQCIVQGLDGLTFPAAEPGEPLRVEYPFFFDQ
jgi:hypothetical protein